ncbi:MAG: hypothetical protein Q9192_007838 [Flavoplaca navasiana]
MPTLHRLATLRDDVIFFVYIYQAWAYKVDYTRVNEFGQGGEDEPGMDDEKKKEKEKAVVVGKMDGDVGVGKKTGSESGKAKKRR